MKNAIRNFRRSLSVLLAVAMVLTTVPDLAVVASAEGDGQTYETTGTENADAMGATVDAASGETGEVVTGDQGTSTTYTVTFVTDSNAVESITDVTTNSDNTTPITDSKIGDVESGKTVKFKVAVKDGYEIKWVGQGDEESTAEGNTLPVDNGVYTSKEVTENTTIYVKTQAKDTTSAVTHTVTFYKDDNATVTVTGVGGTTANETIANEGVQTVTDGETIEFKVTPASSNYAISVTHDAYTVGGETTSAGDISLKDGTTDTYAFTVNADLNIRITATLLQKYTVSFNADSNVESITNVTDADNSTQVKDSKISDVTSGSKVKFTVTAKSGYEVDWVGQGTTESAAKENLLSAKDGVYESQEITTGTTIYVKTKVLTHKVTFTTNDSRVTIVGKYSWVTEYSVDDNKTVSFTVTPSSRGYQVDWVGVGALPETAEQHKIEAEDGIYTTDAITADTQIYVKTSPRPTKTVTFDIRDASDLENTTSNAAVYLNPKVSWEDNVYKVYEGDEVYFEVYTEFGSKAVYVGTSKEYEASGAIEPDSYDDEYDTYDEYCLGIVNDDITVYIKTENVDTCNVTIDKDVNVDSGSMYIFSNYMNVGYESDGDVAHEVIKVEKGDTLELGIGANDGYEIDWVGVGANEKTAKQSKNQVKADADGIYTTPAIKESTKLFVRTKKVAELTKLTVDGVKNGVLTQEVDSRKEYKIITTPNVSTDRLYVTSSSEDVSASIEDGKLVVITSLSKAAQAAAGVIKFYDVYNNDSTEVCSITVNTAEPALATATPTAKVAASTTNTITLTLGAPKTVTAPYSGAIYYKVEGNDKVQYVAKDGESQNVKITVDEYSAEHKDYTFNVTMVQTNNSDETLSQENLDSGKLAILYTSKSQSVTGSTKAPAYETKLSVKKGTTTLYTGQKKVLVGTVQFSKATSYMNVEADVDVFSGLKVTVEDGKVYVSVPYYCAPGKYTIKLYAEAPDNAYPASTTLQVTVVEGIGRVTVNSPAGSIYKATNKAASLKVTTQLDGTYFYDKYEGGHYGPDEDKDYGRSGVSVYKPASNKVTYQIVDEDGYDLYPYDSLYGNVTVNKSGVVTVAKNFLPSKYGNSFRVKATAADYEGNTTYGLSDVITITSAKKEISSLQIAIPQMDEDDEDVSTYTVVTPQSGNQYTSSQLSGAYVIALKAGARNIAAAGQPATYRARDVLSTASLAFKSGNAKAVSVSDSGRLSVSKVAKNVKLTVSTTDGGKQSKSITLSVVNKTVDTIGLTAYRYSAEGGGYYSLSETDPITNDTNGCTLSISAIDGYIRLYVTTADNNGVTLDGLTDYTLKVSGAKIKASGLNYVDIIANQAKATVTISYKRDGQKQSQVYTIINEKYNQTQVLKASTKDKIFAYRYAEQTVTYTLSGNGYDFKDKYVVVAVDAAAVTAKNEDAYDGLYTFLDDAGSRYKVSEDGKVTLTFDVDYETDGSYYHIPEGSYKLLLTAGTVTDGQFAADAKPVSVTLNVAKAKVIGSYKPVSSVTFKSGETKVKLAGKGKNVLYEGYYKVYNVIDKKGKTNKFADYFEIKSETSGEGDDQITTYYLQPKEGVDISKISKEDLTGYVGYYVEYGDKAYYGEYGGSAKITVKVTK